MIKNKKGFTLIEILTVIMIIGILASVILISMGTARDRTADTTIKSQMSQFRTLAEAHYDFGANFDGFEEASRGEGPDGERFIRVKNDILKMNNADPANEARYFGIHFSERNRDYCIYARMVRNTDEVFCVDSDGDARTEIVETGDTPTCSDENVSCSGGGTGAIPCADSGEACSAELPCCDGSACNLMSPICP